MNEFSDLTIPNNMLDTNDVEALLHHNHLIETGRNPERLPIIARFFAPDDRMQWVIVSGKVSDGGLVLFGWCDLGLGFSCLEDVRLSTIAGVQNDYGVLVERDPELTLADHTRLDGWFELEFDT